VISILVASHGRLAGALLETAVAMVGPQQAVAAVEIGRAESPEPFRQRLRALAGDVPGCAGTLVLVDMVGGTPYNSAMALARERPGEQDCLVVSGANLPMLLEALTRRESARSLAELARAVTRAGREHIGQHPPAD